MQIGSLHAPDVEFGSLQALQQLALHRTEQIESTHVVLSIVFRLAQPIKLSCAIAVIFQCAQERQITRIAGEKNLSQVDQSVSSSS